MNPRLDWLLAQTRARAQARDTGGWDDKIAALVAECHPKQQAFVLDPGSRVCARVARGGGKTTAGRVRFLRRMLTTPRAKCLYIATTRGQAEELLWSPLKDTLEKLEIAATFNETKLRCTLKRNGAQLRLVGADDKRELEKLRGLPHHEVGIDEGASYPAQILEHLLFRILGPRLGDYGGMLWMIGTPGHLLGSAGGPFYDATRPGSDIARAWEDRELSEYVGWQRWSFHHWSLQDGAQFVPAMERLWAEALREKDRNGWTDENPVWRREYLGFPAADDTENCFKYRPHTDDGAEWNEWDPERTVQGFAKLPPGDWSYVFGMDMGHSDPFALEVFAYSRTEKRLYHVYEFHRRGMYAKTIAQQLLGEELDHAKPTGVIGVTGWPDGMVADTAGLGDALLDELRNVYGISVEPAVKRDKFDSIELFNGDLIDGRIKILKGSELANQLAALQWAVDDAGKLKENRTMRNDCTDAAIYARRKAAHQFAEDAPPPQPRQGSPAASEQAMREQESREAGLDRSDGYGWLDSPNGFDSFFGN